MRNPFKCSEKVNLAYLSTVIDICSHKMASNVKIINIVFDLICFIIILILFMVIKITLYGTAEGLYPTKQGFLCGDTSIQKPYKESYLGHEVIIPLSFIIPIVVVSLHYSRMFLSTVIVSVKVEKSSSN